MEPPRPFPRAIRMEPGYSSRPMTFVPTPPPLRSIRAEASHRERLHWRRALRRMRPRLYDAVPLAIGLIAAVCWSLR